MVDGPGAGVLRPVSQVWRQASTSPGSAAHQAGGGGLKALHQQFRMMITVLYRTTEYPILYSRCPQLLLLSVNVR